LKIKGLRKKGESKNYRPLYLQLVIATVCFVLAFTISISIIVMKYQKKIVFKNTLANFQILAENGNILFEKNNIVNNKLFGNEKFRDYYKNLVVNIDSLKAVSIHSLDARMLFSEKKQIDIDELKRFSYKVTFEDPKTYTSEKDGKKNIVNKNIIKLIYPVKDSKAKDYIYQAVFYVDLGEMLVHHFSMIKTILMFLFIMSLFYLGYAIYFFNNSITKPLRNFITVAKNITRGRFKQKVRYKTNNEYQEFVTQFNNMIDFLWASRLEDRLAHPSTGLPTSASIVEKVNGLLKKGDNIAFGMIFVENQEHYIQQFGVAYGENLMGFVTQTIFNNAYEIDPNFYLAHSSDSVFLGVSSPKMMFDILKNVIINFESEIAAFLESNNINDIDSIKLKAVCVDNSEGHTISSHKELESIVMEIKRDNMTEKIVLIVKTEGSIEKFTMMNLLGKTEEEVEEVVDKPEEVVEEPEEVIEEPEEVVEESEQVVEESEQVIEEPEQVVEESEQVIEESEQVIEESEQVVEEPEEVVEEPEQVIEEPEQVVEESGEVVEESEQVIEEPEQVVEESGEVVEESEQVIEEPEQVIEEPEQVFEEPEQVIEEKKPENNTDESNLDQMSEDEINSLLKDVESTIDIEPDLSEELNLKNKKGEKFTDDNIESLLSEADSLVTGLIDESQLNDNIELKENTPVENLESEEDEISEKTVTENELKDMVKDNKQVKSEVDIMTDDEIKKLLGEDE